MAGKRKMNKKIAPTQAGDKDIERLRKNIYLSDMEKLSLFTKMLRRNALYKKATVTHK